METLLGLSRVIDRVNEIIGKAMGVAILLAVLVSATNAIIRKAFNMSSNSWLELQWYLFGAAFLLAAAYTLKQNEHIRIDIVYGAFSRRTQHWIDLLGHIFFPDALRRADVLDDGALRLARLAERRDLDQCRRADHLAGAGDPGAGLHPAGRSRAISEIIKKIAVMRGVIDDPHPVHLGA